jgi:mercuric reductase
LHGTTATAWAGLKVLADKTIQEVSTSSYDLLYLPGVSPFHFDEFLHDSVVADLVKSFYNAGKPIAAACLAPLVLGECGLLRDRVVCADAPAKDFDKYGVASVSNAPVVVDGQIITAKGPAVIWLTQVMFEVLGLPQMGANLIAFMNKAGGIAPSMPEVIVRRDAKSSCGKAAPAPAAEQQSGCCGGQSTPPPNSEGYPGATKVAKAVNHLNALLPLKERQEKVPPHIKKVHQAVLRSFAERGRILTKDEIAQMVPNLDDTVSVLKQNDLVVFNCAGEPFGSYPFTMESRAHKVQVNSHHVHAMCALDSLGISPMVGHDTVIESKCSETGAPIRIEQSCRTLKNVEQLKDVYFGIAWNAPGSCCANSLCTEMIFLKGSDVAQKWQSTSPSGREIFDIHEAVEFASEFFQPLLAD